MIVVAAMAYLGCLLQLWHTMDVYGEKRGHENALTLKTTVCGPGLIPGLLFLNDCFYDDGICYSV